MYRLRIYGKSDHASWWADPEVWCSWWIVWGPDRIPVAHHTSTHTAQMLISWYELFECDRLVMIGTSPKVYIGCQMTPQGLYSLSGKTSYRKISWSLEAARFGFELFQSLWNLAGTSEALLPRCLSNFRVIRPLQHPISRLRDFTRFGGKTSYRLVNKGPVYEISGGGQSCQMQHWDGVERLLLLRECPLPEGGHSEHVRGPSQHCAVDDMLIEKLHTDLGLWDDRQAAHMQCTLEVWIPLPWRSGNRVCLECRWSALFP